MSGHLLPAPIAIWIQRSMAAIQALGNRIWAIEFRAISFGRSDLAPPGGAYRLSRVGTSDGIRCARCRDAPRAPDNEVVPLCTRRAAGLGCGDGLPAVPPGARSGPWDARRTRPGLCGTDGS